MGKKVLKIDEDWDMSLIGLSSPLKDYRLGYFLSKSLWPRLERVEDLQWTYPKQNRTLFFSNFSLNSEIPDQKIFLFSNRSSGAFYIPSLKEFDYLILWSPGIQWIQTKDFLVELKKTPEILEARSVKLEWIKETDRLKEFIF